MDLNNRKSLKNTAKQRLEASESAPKIALIFAGILAAVSLVLNLVSFLLEVQIDRSTGLSNIGLRSTLSTVQAFLSPLASLFLMGLTMGFTGTMLRTARGQFTSPQGMKIGFARFWVLLRSEILLGLFYFAAILIGSQLGFSLFLMTPLSNSFMGIVESMMGTGAALDPMSLLMDAAAEADLLLALTPMLLLTSLISLALMLPVYYRYRMTRYVILDNPGMGAVQSMRMSAMMMRKKHMAMFKLDLSMWWYYLGTLAAFLVGYATTFLALAGIQLPLSPMAAFLVFLGAYLVVGFLVNFFLRPRMEVIVAGAYDAIRPRPREPEGGVVLGNIFNM